jgi:hypothetical protein
MAHGKRFNQRAAMAQKTSLIQRVLDQSRSQQDGCHGNHIFPCIGTENRALGSPLRDPDKNGRLNGSADHASARLPLDGRGRSRRRIQTDLHVEQTQCDDLYVEKSTNMCAIRWNFVFPCQTAGSIAVHLPEEAATCRLAGSRGRVYSFEVSLKLSSEFRIKRGRWNKKIGRCFHFCPTCQFHLVVASV